MQEEIRYNIIEFFCDSNILNKFIKSKDSKQQLYLISAKIKHNEVPTFQQNLFANLEATFATISEPAGKLWLMSGPKRTIREFSGSLGSNNGDTAMP